MNLSEFSELPIGSLIEAETGLVADLRGPGFYVVIAKAMVVGFADEPIWELQTIRVHPDNIWSGAESRFQWVHFVEWHAARIWRRA